MIEAASKQLLAIVAGGLFGLMLLAGLLVLMHRRWSTPRIRATTTPMDWAVLWLILVQLLLGLATIAVSWQHRDGGEMVRLMTWAQHIVTFRTDAAAFVADVAPVFKLHLVFGLTLSNQAWAALGEQVVPTVPAEIRPLVVGTALLALVGAVLGLVLGARAGMGGAIVGLVGGAILGAAIGALSAITFTPEVGAAIGVSVALMAWPILLGIDVARRGIDTEALAAKFTPRETMDMTKETIEWVRARTPLGPKS